MSKKLFIVSGEESGDLHGSALIKELKKLVPGLEFHGMGGYRMREAGLKGLDSVEVSVVGIVEVLEKSPKIMATLSALKKRLRTERFDAAVFIDFPDFNLRLAKEAKAQGIPVIYYISPQVWAWRKGRIKKIARLVDKMLVILPFEVEIYRRAGVDVEYVGHPLSDAVKCSLSKAKARAAINLPAKGPVIALLPGSRSAEVSRHLPVMLDAAALIQHGLGVDTAFIIPAARSVKPGAFIEAGQRAGIDVTVVSEKMYEALRAADAAVVASGTATLETAIIGTPMVIIYRVSSISYGIGRALISVDNIGLPNIIAGERVAKELIQNEVTGDNISAEILDILKNSKKRRDIIKKLKEIKALLGKGAARNAARSVAAFMDRGGKS